MIKMNQKLYDLAGLWSRLEVGSAPVSKLVRNFLSEDGVMFSISSKFFCLCYICVMFLTMKKMISNE